MKSNKPETQPKCSEQRVLDELFINTIPGPAHEQESQEKSKTMCSRIIVAFSSHVRILGGGEGWWWGGAMHFSWPVLFHLQWRSAHTHQFTL